MTYALLAHYWMQPPRAIDRLPTISTARRRISALLDEGAEEVELFAVDGDKARKLEVVSRKETQKCWSQS